MFIIISEHLSEKIHSIYFQDGERNVFHVLSLDGKKESCGDNNEFFEKLQKIRYEKYYDVTIETNWSAVNAAFSNSLLTAYWETVEKPTLTLITA